MGRGVARRRNRAPAPEELEESATPHLLIAKDSRALRAGPDYVFQTFNGGRPDPPSRERGATGVPDPRI